MCRENIVQLLAIYRVASLKSKLTRRISDVELYVLVVTHCQTQIKSRETVARGSVRLNV